MIGHSALGSLLIGWESGFHYYLLMFIPAIVIANTRGYATPMVLALLAYYLGLHMLSDAVGPLHPLPAQSVKIVNWVHICVVFAMSAALSAFYRRIILIAEARLRKQATRDPLTGLANRSHFDAQATEALERSQRSGVPVTLLLCDVDHFKSLFKVFLKSHKCLAGMGCKARCTADSPCYRQAPQRRRPPGKALARRVGVKSGDWTPRLLAWA